MAAETEEQRLQRTGTCSKEFPASDFIHACASIIIYSKLAIVSDLIAKGQPGEFACSTKRVGQ